jgi:hypothetical protein
MADGNVDRATDDLRDRIKQMCEHDARLSQSAVAREAGLSAATVSQWMAGKYAGDNVAIEKKLLLWLEAHLAREAEASQLPPGPGYVPTHTAERVSSALRYAQLAGDIAVVYGGAGLGKTCAIEHFRQRAPNVWVATMSPATRGVVTCLQRVCDALGMPNLAGGAATLDRAIARRVRDTRGLLVIDEAQHLTAEALDQVRSIHDETGIGVALVGNETVYARMTGGIRAPYLDRLHSRIGKRVRLQRATEADIDDLISAWGVQDSACRSLLVDIATKPGALRGLTKCMRLASTYAKALKRAVCCADVKKASRELGLAGGGVE